MLGVPGLAILSDALLGGRKMLGVQVSRCAGQAHKLGLAYIGVLSSMTAVTEVCFKIVMIYWYTLIDFVCTLKSHSVLFSLH